MKWIILSLCLSLTSFAQAVKTYKFKISDIDLRSSLGDLQLTAPGGLSFWGEASGDYLAQSGFASKSLLYTSQLLELEQRKSLFPNAIISFQVDQYGYLVVNDKTIRLLSTGENQNNQNSEVQKLKAQVAQLKSDISEMINKDVLTYIENRLNKCESEKVDLQVILSQFQVNNDQSELNLKSNLAQSLESKITDGVVNN